MLPTSRIHRTLHAHAQNSLVWVHVECFFPGKTLLGTLQLKGSYPSNINSVFCWFPKGLPARVPEFVAFCMRTAQNYAISENDMLETTIFTSTNTTGTLTRDDLDQAGTTYSTYPAPVV